MPIFLTMTIACFGVMVLSARTPEFLENEGAAGKHGTKTHGRVSALQKIQ
jgi:hypothetical protein